MVLIVVTFCSAAVMKVGCICSIGCITCSRHTYVETELEKLENEQVKCVMFLCPETGVFRCDVWWTFCFMSSLKPPEV